MAQPVPGPALLPSDGNRKRSRSCEPSSLYKTSSSCPSTYWAPNSREPPGLDHQCVQSQGPALLCWASLPSTHTHPRHPTQPLHSHWTFPGMDVGRGRPPHFTLLPRPVYTQPALSGQLLYAHALPDWLVATVV